MLRLFVLHGFDMKRLVFDLFSFLEIYLHLRELHLDITLSNCYGRCQTPDGDILTIFRPHLCQCISVSKLLMYTCINVRSFIKVDQLILIIQVVSVLQVKLVHKYR